MCGERQTAVGAFYWLYNETATDSPPAGDMKERAVVSGQSLNNHPCGKNHLPHTESKPSLIKRAERTKTQPFTSSTKITIEIGIPHLLEIKLILKRSKTFIRTATFLTCRGFYRNGAQRTLEDCNNTRAVL